MRRAAPFLAGFIFFLAVAFVPPAAAIDITPVRSPSGITAWLVEDHTNPIVTFSFAFRGGAALDPVGKEGLSKLAASTLDEGAGELDSQEFQGRLEDLATSLRFDAGLEMLTGSFQTLTDNSEASFELLRLALTQPRFDPEPVARIQRQLVAKLRRDSENPRSVAARALMRRLFPEHPYGRPTDGYIETVPLIKVADLKVFVAERLARDNLIVSVVGDITPDELARRLDEVFGALPQNAEPWVLPDAEPIAADRVEVIDMAVPQTALRWGQPGLLRKDPDFFPAYIMNHVLGGAGFESRLVNEIREKRGLAYSTYSSLVTLDQAGLIMGGADTRNDSADETLTVMREVWRDLADNGITREELDDAKTYITGSYALQFSSSSGIASVLMGIQTEELGIDYIDRRNELIAAVGPEGVKRVAKNLLKPDGLSVIAVGQPTNIAPKP